jgi:hypothetical protein
MMSILPPGRIATLAYDKAADDEKVHDFLHGAGIKPLIPNRSLWPEDDRERPLPGQAGRYPLHVVHDEAGTVYCYDRVSDPPVRHPMAYIGYEKGRGALKYRCPARHQGWACPSDGRCNEGRAYGLAVRVDVGFVVGQVDLEDVQPAVDGLDEAELPGQGVQGADAAVVDAADTAGRLIVDVGGGEHGSVTATEVRLVEAPLEAARALFSHRRRMLFTRNPSSGLGRQSRYNA